jgi:hypothetical protein
MPNAGRIRGEIVLVEPEADGFGSTWEVAVRSVQDVPGFANFARSYLGGTLRLYVHPGLQDRAAVHDHIAAKVAFRGDERGGRFVVLDDDLHKEYERSDCGVARHHARREGDLRDGHAGWLAEIVV